MIYRRFDTFYTKVFFRDRPFLLIGIGALCIHGLIWLLLILGFDTFRATDTEYITLHYRIIFGTDFIARWESIFLIPGLGAGMIVLNTMIARAIYHIGRIVSVALMSAACVGNALLLLVLYLLLQINQ